MIKYSVSSKPHFSSLLYGIIKFKKFTILEK